MANYEEGFGFAMIHADANRRYSRSSDADFCVESEPEKYS
jgi:hypothetical protein